MIDFRYHLVSIIAIFLALAVGLLVGSTYISGFAEEALSHTEKVVTQDNLRLSGQVKSLNQQLAADNQFATASSRLLLAPGGIGLLNGQNVVLVAAPGADSQMTTGVTDALHTAGATVTGEILLQPSFLDGSGQTESSLTTLAHQLTPPGFVLPSNPVNSAVAGQQDAAAVIAASIVSKDGVGFGTVESQNILAGFARNGYLQLGNGATSLQSATLAVLLIPSAPEPQTANWALVALATELQASGRGTVMSGTVSSTDGSGDAITLAGSSAVFSTVDNADAVTGQIIVAQALRNLLGGKPPQAYGVVPVAAPNPPPTAPVAPTSTPSVSGSGGTHR